MQKKRLIIGFFLCLMSMLLIAILTCSSPNGSIGGGSGGGGGGGDDDGEIIDVGGNSNYTTVISGTVRDQNGGAVLQGVTILATGNGNVVQVTTNAAGSYSFTVTHNGNISIGATLNAYMPYAGTISTTANTYNQNIQLQSQIAVQNYNTTVNGRVTNQNGTGLANVTILATGSANVVQATTNATGNYSVNVAHTGNIGIGAGLNGYLPYTIIISTTANNYTQNIQLQTQVVNPNCTTVVSGRVTNQNGTGLANVSISATAGVNIVQVTTNATGNYSFTITHNGTIAIGAILIGYRPYSNFISTNANTYTANIILLSL